MQSAGYLLCTFDQDILNPYIWFLLCARYAFARLNKNRSPSVRLLHFLSRKPVSWAVWSPNVAPHRGNSEKDQLHLLHLRFPSPQPPYFTHTGLNSQLQAITARTHWLTVSRLPLDGPQIDKDSLEYGQCKSISGFVSSRQLVGETKGCGFENSVAILTCRQIFIPSNLSISE